MLRGGGYNRSVLTLLSGGGYNRSVLTLLSCGGYSIGACSVVEDIVGACSVVVDIRGAYKHINIVYLFVHIVKTYTD